MPTKKTSKPNKPASKSTATRKTTRTPKRHCHDEKEQNGSKKKGLFLRFAQAAANFTGSSWAFITACMVVLIWAVSGPIFAFSDTWQLVINTGTTIITFLMVFLIQNTQNRDTRAMQLKLDELIRVTKGAQLEMLDLEELDEKELIEINNTYEELACKARKDNHRGNGHLPKPDRKTTTA